MVAHTTRDFRAGANRVEPPQPHPSREGRDVAKAVENMDISRRMADLEEAIEDKETSIVSATQKLEDLRLEGMLGSIKRLGMGVQVVSSVLGQRSQKIMRVLSGVGQLLTGLGDTWARSVNIQRSEESLESATRTLERRRAQMDALSGSGNGPGRGMP